MKSAVILYALEGPYFAHPVNTAQLQFLGVQPSRFLSWNLTSRHIKLKKNSKASSVGVGGVTGQGISWCLLLFSDFGERCTWVIESMERCCGLQGRSKDTMKPSQWSRILWDPSTLGLDKKQDLFLQGADSSSWANLSHPFHPCGRCC